MDTARYQDFRVDQRVVEANSPSSPYIDIAGDAPLQLECAQQLAPFRIAYMTYGELNAARSNAILVCHALTGDQHVATSGAVLSQHFEGSGRDPGVNA